jgi:regulatory protein
VRLPCFPAHSYLCFASVRAHPRKVSTEQEIYAASLRALERRAYSIHEMRDYLKRRAENEELISRVIGRLRERNYLDDARYALDFARQHAQTRRQGRFRIARELRSKGVPDRHIESALDTVFAETDEASLVRVRLARRLASMGGALGPKKIASLYGSLLRAGFSSDVIRAELKGIARTHLADPTDIVEE